MAVRSGIPSGPADDGNPFGTPEIEIHYAVDVVRFRRLTSDVALACHASQTSDAGAMLAMPAGSVRPRCSASSGSSSRAGRQASTAGRLLT